MISSNDDAAAMTLHDYQVAARTTDRAADRSLAFPLPGVIRISARYLDIVGSSIQLLHRELNWASTDVLMAAIFFPCGPQ